MKATDRKTLIVQLCTLIACAITVPVRLPAAETESTVPGDLTVRPTLSCIGIRWASTGDEDCDATCAVRFRRQGESEWREALPLLRVRYRYGKRSVNALAGSIFHLAPGTPYEIRLSLSDPDGGRAKNTITTRTRDVPRPVPGGRTIRVTPDNLADAQKQAGPGDVLLLAAGDYGSACVLSASGAPAKPILFRGPEQDEALFTGTVQVKGSHLWLDHITIKMSGGLHTYGLVGKNGARDITVTRCRVTGPNHCIDANGEDWTLLDNVLVGDKKSRPPHPSEDLGGEGIQFSGRGHVAAFNTISYVADGMSYGAGDIDIHNNLIQHATDDLLEPDYSWDNYRMWANNLCGGMPDPRHVNGISFQGINGGPWYIFRNQITGTHPHVFKLRWGGGPRVVVNNTLVAGPGTYTMSADVLFRELIWANNIWVTMPRAQLAYTSNPWKDRNTVKIMGHNAYDARENGVFKFKSPLNLADLRRLGFEKHSLMIQAREELANLPADPQVLRREGVAEPLVLRAQSRLIDAGLALPNLLGPVAGKAPDLGAYEHGLGVPWVGARSYTPDGRLACGLPNDWQMTPLDRLGEFRSLGAPATAPHGRLLLTRDRPRAFILASFQPLPPEQAWAALARLTPRGEANVYYVRDGLAMRVWDKANDKHATMEGFRVEPDGLLRVTAGAATTEPTAVRSDFLTVMWSLYY